MQNEIVDPAQWFGTVTGWSGKGEGTITEESGWFTINVPRLRVAMLLGAAPSIGDRVSFDVEIWARNVRHEKPMLFLPQRAGPAKPMLFLPQRAFLCPADRDTNKVTLQKKPASAKTKKAVMKVLQVMKKPASAKTKTSPKTKK
jgi:hypothetical protein